jgi:predicted AlkP superfamily phosphohydrolase/phosphomutase
MAAISRRRDGPRVLAIGIDAAEPTLVKRMVAEGALPNLRALADEGAWRELDAHADLGSAAVWPSFLTGTDPDSHGRYGEWEWEPETMAISRWGTCEPFWAGLESELRVGALDVPLASPTNASAFDVSEWGPHYRIDDRTMVSPTPIEAIVRSAGPHPLASRRGALPAPHDAARIAHLGEACLAGIRRRGELADALIRETRPDLTVVVFPEIHDAGHALWHTAEPASPLYRDLRSCGAPPKGGMDALLREVDLQVGRLLEAVAPDAPVAVFSLSGMGPARGKPAFLAPVLHERGWSAATPRLRNPGELAGLAFAAAKRRAPASVRRAYHTVMARPAVWRVAQMTLLAGHDWARTRAFVLPSEQHGWVRINLRGRERDGIVAAQDYGRVYDELAAELAELKTAGGRALVSRVLPGSSAGRAHPRLPDLVVHWTEAAFERPVQVAGTSVVTLPIAPDVTGRHRPDGFGITRGLQPEAGPLLAEQLPDMLVSAATG